MAESVKPDAAGVLTDQLAVLDQPGHIADHLVILLVSGASRPIVIAYQTWIRNACFDRRRPGSRIRGVLDEDLDREHELLAAVGPDRGQGRGLTQHRVAAEEPGPCNVVPLGSRDVGPGAVRELQPPGVPRSCRDQCSTEAARLARTSALCRTPPSVQATCSSAHNRSKTAWSQTVTGRARKRAV